MAERNLAETILWCNPTAVVAIDGAKRICYSNRAAQIFLSTESNSLDGRNVVEFFGDDEGLIKAIHRAYRNREENHLRLPLVRGEHRMDVQLTLSPYFEQATPPMMVISFRDVKQRQLIDDRVRQLERIASAERLVGGFAHQLRNPLAAISALAENLAAEMSDSDPRIEYTSRLLSQVTQMERLIRACLEFGQDVSAKRQRTSAESIGRAAITAFEVQNGVAPRLVIEAGTDDVIVSRQQVAKCLCLLLERALGASGDVNKIELLVAPEHECGGNRLVRFVVRDEGPTIERSDLAMLFEPFYTKKAKGMGMGLASAQTLAVHNGGVLEARSKPGDTQFILRLNAVNIRDIASGSDETPLLS